MIAIGITATPIFIRLTRGQVLTRQGRGLRRGRARGRQLARWRIALRHILPNIMPPLIGAGHAGHRRGRSSPRPACRSWASGQQPPAPSLGQHAEHGAALPRQRAVDGDLAGPAIFLLVLSFNLLGDGLRDALDPRHR